MNVKIELQDGVKYDLSDVACGLVGDARQAGLNHQKLLSSWENILLLGKVRGK